MTNNEQPRDYDDQPGQYIIELMPKLVAWLVAICQCLIFGLGAFGLSVLIELKSDFKGFSSDVRSLTQRVDKHDDDIKELRVEIREVERGRR